MAIMRRTLGRTGADVTVLGYGAMELRGLPRGPQIADGCPLELPADATPPYKHDYSPANVRADVEQSLRRLRTDRLDLVQVHMSPSVGVLADNRTVETLAELKDEGKVTQAVDAGAGTLIRGGAARGAASDEKNWRNGPIGVTAEESQRRWQVSGLEDLLDEAGMSRMEFVLRFTLSHPGLSSTIVGTANPAHLTQNITVAERGPLPADLYTEAKKRLRPDDA